MEIAGFSLCRPLVVALSFLARPYLCFLVKRIHLFRIRTSVIHVEPQAVAVTLSFSVSEIWNYFENVFI